VEATVKRRASAKADELAMARKRMARREVLFMEVAIGFILL
jgi:hypothetical protein